MSASPGETLDPVVVHLGKVKRKQVKQLQEGRGPLLEEVGEVIGEVCAGLGEEVAGKTVLPIIVVYRERPKKRRLPQLFRM